MQRPYPQHHRALIDWLDKVPRVLQEWEDWKSSLDIETRRTLGLSDPRTLGR